MLPSRTTLRVNVVLPAGPVPAFRHPQPLEPGQVVQADVALGPSAPLFRAGETLRLVVAGRGV